MPKRRNIFGCNGNYEGQPHIHRLLHFQMIQRKESGGYLLVRMTQLSHGNLKEIWHANLILSMVLLQLVLLAHVQIFLGYLSRV